MIADFERTLQTYADIAIKVGLNLQPGQRLLIIGPLANGGVSLDAAPLVRNLARSAYEAGAPLVEAIWGDDSLMMTRFRHAPRESFSQFSSWLPKALVDHVDGGHAFLSVYANDPDQLKNEPAEIVSAVQQSTARGVQPFREHISRNQTNWGVIAAAADGWAARVFPDAAPSERLRLLWDAIVRFCRLDLPDPVAAWERHLAALAARTETLNRKQYVELHYRAPGTDLRIALPRNHVWVGGRSVSRNGIPFAPNLPTEEVFTMPRRDGVEGSVRSTKPLSYGGTLIDDFSLTFAGGHVVNLSARHGEAMLRHLIDTDDGAGRLGEVALVPHSSPIAQSGMLFFNTLFDENAASHVALGTAYKFTLQGGESMSEEQFEAAGGNRSAIHVDFMIGSADLDIDAVLPGGTTEPLMRRGEWAN